MALIFAALGLVATVRAGVSAAGAYSGAYQSGDQQSNLAMFVDDTGWAGLLRLNRTWASGGCQEDLQVGTDGWSRGFTTSGSVLTGTITGTNLHGSCGGGSAAGTLTSRRLYRHENRH